MTARPPLAVCSWSLQPASAMDLVRLVEDCGLGAVQLALDPVREAGSEGAWTVERTRDALGDAGITIVSGMMTTEGEDYASIARIRETGGVRPTATWAANLERARGNADAARALGLDLVTLHAGFVPEDPADDEFDTMVARLTELAQVFDRAGCRLGLETGQESAPALLELLGRLPDSVGVNVDPANMLLYSTGDPVEALRRVAPRVVQVHVKDAIPSGDRETWGEEVPAGEGAVPWADFLAAVPDEVGLVIEREAGSSRAADVRTAAALVRRLDPTIVG